MNERALDAINGLAGRAGVIDAAGRFGANDAVFLLGLLAAMLGLMALRRDFGRGFTIGLAGAAGAGVALLGAFLLAHLVHEARPFVSDSDTVLLIHHGADNAFPSDHATLAAAVATVGALAWRRWALLFAGLALFIGLSRVFVGVHYPADVLAGWAIGAAAGAGAWYGMRRVRLPVIARPRAA